MESRSRIFIRTDSGSRMGLGHAMRCLTLAELVKEEGNAQIHFICRELPGNINHLIRERGFEVQPLKTNSEEELIRLLREERADWLIIDHYDIERSTEKRLKESPALKLFVLDDQIKEHHADVLLNHNICAKASNYQGKVNPDCLVLAGPAYTLIRKEFRQIRIPPRRPEGERACVFLAIGGTDVHNTLPELLRQLSHFPNLEVHMATTRSNPHLTRLQIAAAQYPGWYLHIDHPNMAELMAMAHIGIVSPSVISAECIFMELPLIAIKVVDNQSNTFSYLREKGFLTLERHEIPDFSAIFAQLLDEGTYVRYYQMIRNEKNQLSTKLSEIAYVLKSS